MLLAVAVLGLLAPWLDPGLTGRTHRHVFNGGTPEQQARALQAHLRAWGETHRAPATRAVTTDRATDWDPTAPANSPVISVADEATGLTAPGTSMLSTLLQTEAEVAPRSLITHWAALRAATTYDDPLAAVPTTPPRILSLSPIHGA